MIKTKIDEIIEFVLRSKGKFATFKEVAAQTKMPAGDVEALARML